MRLDDAPFAELARIYGELEDEGRRAVANTSVAPHSVTVARAADMRYVGQEHAVTVDLPMRVFATEDRGGIKRHFDAMHLTRYGTSAPAERAEIVSLRSTVTGVMRKPPLAHVARGGATPPREAFTGKRPVYFAGRGFVATRTFARAALLAGNRITGPALIEEHASTTVLMPGDSLKVDGFGNLDIAVGSGGRRNRK
jgi:N-methylhydantoinase A